LRKLYSEGGEKKKYSSSTKGEGKRKAFKRKGDGLFGRGKTGSLPSLCRRTEEGIEEEASLWEEKKPLLVGGKGERDRNAPPNALSRGGGEHFSSHGGGKEKKP